MLRLLRELFGGRGAGTKTRCRTGYLLVHSGNSKQRPTPTEHFVDSQDKDEVYYLFHVYLSDPDAKIYVCYNDGSRRRITLGRPTKKQNSER